MSDGHARAAMRNGLATDNGFRDKAVIVCADSDLDLVSKRRGDLALGDRMTRNEDALYALEADVEALEAGPAGAADCWNDDNPHNPSRECDRYWGFLDDAARGHRPSGD